MNQRDSHCSRLSRRAPPPLPIVAVAVLGAMSLVLACSSGPSPEVGVTPAGDQHAENGASPTSVQPREAPVKYVVSDVGKEAKPFPSNPAPRYPESLQVAGVSGTVIAAFVIDTTGRVVMRTFKVVFSNNELFTEAVMAALRSARFYPAEKDGHPVNELGTTPYTFNVGTRGGSENPQQPR